MLRLTSHVSKSVDFIVIYGYNNLINLIGCVLERSNWVKALRTLRNYLCYCGIEKEDYNAVKKGAYISNFRVWRILNFLMTTVFGAFFINSMVSDMLVKNRIAYLAVLIYCVIVTVLFFIINEESIGAQLLIYLSISVSSSVVMYPPISLITRSLIMGNSCSWCITPPPRMMRCGLNTITSDVIARAIYSASSSQTSVLSASSLAGFPHLSSIAGPDASPSKHSL